MLTFHQAFIPTTIYLPTSHRLLLIMKKLKKIILCIFGLRLKYLTNKKISHLYKALNHKITISSGIRKDHKRLWAPLNPSLNKKWQVVYSTISGIIDHRYITEYDYYHNVEPKLNNKGLSEAYCDKNNYHHLLPQHLLPEVYLRNIEGVFYDQSYELINKQSAFDHLPQVENSRIILKKALDSGGGRQVELFVLRNGIYADNNGNILSLDYLNKHFDDNYLVQEYIIQYPYFQRFNETSVNTVRIFTYRSVLSNEIIILQSVLRIGKPGAIVDNQASGGIAVGIRFDGSLNGFAVNKKGERINSVNGITLSKIEPIPMFLEMNEMAISIAKKFVYHRLLGFDFCVNSEGLIKLIEVNNKNNEINFYQMSNGPLFREFTNEIIDFCKQRERSFTADFKI